MSFTQRFYRTNFQKEGKSPFRASKGKSQSDEDLKTVYSSDESEDEGEEAENEESLFEKQFLELAERFHQASLRNDFEETKPEGETRTTQRSSIHEQSSIEAMAREFQENGKLIVQLIKTTSLNLEEEAHKKLLTRFYNSITLINQKRKLSAKAISLFHNILDIIVLAGGAAALVLLPAFLAKLAVAAGIIQAVPVPTAIAAAPAMKTVKVVAASTAGLGMFGKYFMSDEKTLKRAMAADLKKPEPPVEGESTSCWNIFGANSLRRNAR